MAAAAVNGLVVLVLAPLAYWQMSTGLASTVIVTAAWVASPYAALAAWRTWVYATRWIERRESGWRGVLEAGAAGLLTTLAYFAPMIAGGNVRIVWPVVVYSVLVTVIGLMLGCALRVIALTVLALFRLTGVVPSRP